MKLEKTVRAWGTSRFHEELKREVEQRAVDQLPLSQALRYGNHVADERPAVMIHRAEQQGGYCGQDLAVLCPAQCGFLLCE